MSAFPLLKQRELRWFRFDPRGRFAHIRERSELREPDDTALPAGTMIATLSTWPRVGALFETGAAPVCDVTHPVEDQLRWLAAERPDYLTSWAGQLEQLAVAAADLGVVVPLRGMQAVSDQFTAGMQQRVEHVFGARVQQNYGLNEIGLIASQCPGGRYHVHTEHCLVEILDEHGRPCVAGAVGHVLVTALRNLAMPLLRYASGDLAIAADGPCSCRRTLPTFLRVVGRYRPFVFCPAGTLARTEAVDNVIDAMPRELMRGVRQYRLHQFRTGDCVLSVVCATPLPDGFETRIHAAWRAAGGGSIGLRVARVDTLPDPPGRKPRKFTSDFIPPWTEHLDVPPFAARAQIKMDEAT